MVKQIQIKTTDHRPQTTDQKKSVFGLRSLVFGSLVLWFFSSLVLLLFVPLANATDFTPIWSVNTTQLMVALSFDDGPKPEATEPILDILDRYGVRATFFVVGRECSLYPDLLFRIADAGHEIGSHTYAHRTLTEKNALEELSKTNQIIKEITGSPPNFLRAPGGKYSSKVREIAESLGLRLVNWTVNGSDYVRLSSWFELPDDYASLADEIIKEVDQEIRPGAILLFHKSPQTILALPRIIKNIQAKGYKMMTISQLLKEEGTERE